MPTPPTSTPPRAGPATLGRLWAAVFSDVAFIRCCSGTRRAVIAWLAGNLTAKRRPPTAAITTTCQTAIESVTASTPIAAAATIATALSTSSRSRRLNRSAMTPMGIEPPTNANAQTPSTAPSSSAESVSCTISQPWAVNCTISPKATSRLLAQNHRKRG